MTPTPILEPCRFKRPTTIPHAWLDSRMERLRKAILSAKPNVPRIYRHHRQHVYKAASQVGVRIATAKTPTGEIIVWKLK